MTQLGVKCVRGCISHAECKVCSLKWDHPCNLPADFLGAMRAENDYQPDRTEFTPSTLLECDRRTQLLTSTDHYLDVDHAWNLHRGHAIHLWAEKNGKYPEGSVVDCIREIRLTTTIQTKYGPQVFSGKSDLIVVKAIQDGTAYVEVVDYKTTTIDHSLTEAKRTHQMQLNMYAWLVVQELPKIQTVQRISEKGQILFQLLNTIERVEVLAVEIVYVDWKKLRRFSSYGSLQAQGKLLSRSPRAYETLTLEPISLLPPEVVGGWIRQRIEEKIEAKEELPPPLEGEQAWLCEYCSVRDACFSLAGKS